MTDQEIAELERLEREATSGPWIVETHVMEMTEAGKKEFPEGIPEPHRSMRRVRTAWVHGQLKDRIDIAKVWSTPYYGPGTHVKFDEGDAAFVCAVRNALPRLLSGGLDRVLCTDTWLPGPCSCDCVSAAPAVAEWLRPSLVH